MVRSCYLFELGWTQFLWLQFSCSYINIPNFISIKKLKQLILNLSHLLKSIRYQRIIWLISVQCFVSYRHQSFHLICTANQMTDFYMKCITVLTWVKAKAKYLFKLFAPNAPFLYPPENIRNLEKKWAKERRERSRFLLRKHWEAGLPFLLKNVHLSFFAILLPVNYLNHSFICV